MSIIENIRKVEFRISACAERIGRRKEAIKLLAVTKTHSADLVDQALRAGIKYIGENKVQEAESKLPQIKEHYEEFHFIGHLQSNKVPHLMRLKPALIHSIDKYSTALKLDKYSAKQDRNQDILIQINTSAEESKFGISPQETSDLIEKISRLSHLKIKGLMTIGVFSQNEKEVRACFQLLREIFEEQKSKNVRNVEMKYLSMGMTNDFEIAIEEGANIVRIGSAIFSEREYQWVKYQNSKKQNSNKQQ